jgi:hypothetical protein
MPSDAPTSYPCLWNVPQQTYVQRNAAAPNREFKSHIPDFGQPVDTAALGRNVGEVISVFADIRPSLDAERPGYWSRC